MQGLLDQISEGMLDHEAFKRWIKDRTEMQTRRQSAKRILGAVSRISQVIEEIEQNPGAGRHAQTLENAGSAICIEVNGLIDMQEEGEARRGGISSCLRTLEKRIWGIGSRRGALAHDRTRLSAGASFGLLGGGRDRYRTPFERALLLCAGSATARWSSSGFSSCRRPAGAGSRCRSAGRRARPASRCVPPAGRGRGCAPPAPSRRRDAG